MGTIIATIILLGVPVFLKHCYCAGHFISVETGLSPDTVVHVVRIPARPIGCVGVVAPDIWRVVDIAVIGMRRIKP
jgi:hypothetical protein